jgi:hypothetical protein
VTPRPTPVIAPPDFIDETPGLYPATYVGEYEHEGEWPFPLGVARAELGGSGNCTISIRERGLSGTHAVLERRASSIRIYDLHSTNGTFIGDMRVETSWDIRLGDKFTPWPLTLFLMDDVMQRYRGILSEILARGISPTADSLLTDVVRSACHVLIIGPEGCGQERLARAIHEMSPRRAHDLLTLPPQIPDDRLQQTALLRQASRPKTTMMLPIAATGKFDVGFIESLYSPSYGIRVIAIAPTVKDAKRALPAQQFGQSYHIQLQHLAHRNDMIPHILDRRFSASARADLRTADLLEENQEALRTHDWPGNLDQLHVIADILIAHEVHGGVRPASRALDLAPSSIVDRLAKVGFNARTVPGTERESFFKP